MDFVAIVTPNHLHFPVAKLAIQSSFNVLSDKPATFNLEEALALKTLLDDSSCLYGLTPTYTCLLYTYPSPRDSWASLMPYPPCKAHSTP